MPSRKATATKMTLTSDEEFRQFQRGSSTAVKPVAPKPEPVLVRTPTKVKGGRMSDRDSLRFTFYLRADEAAELSAWCEQIHMPISQFAARAAMDRVRRQKV